MLVNSSIGYRGQFVIVVVPKGSTWSLTISDLPVRAPSEIGPGSPHVANQHDGVWGHKPASDRRAAGIDRASVAIELARPQAGETRGLPFSTT
jgi:hypothetical protein